MGGTEDVDEDGGDFGVVGDEFEGFFDCFGSCSSTTIFISLFPGVSVPRKLAGSPPLSLMISIVAIASPAPFTRHPIDPYHQTHVPRPCVHPTL